MGIRQVTCIVSAALDTQNLFKLILIVDQFCITP
jgi:hypothetical protein